MRRLSLTALIALMLVSVLIIKPNTIHVVTTNAAPKQHPDPIFTLARVNGDILDLPNADDPIERDTIVTLEYTVTDIPSVSRQRSIGIDCNTIAFTIKGLGSGLNWDTTDIVNATLVSSNATACNYEYNLTISSTITVFQGLVVNNSALYWESGPAHVIYAEEEDGVSGFEIIPVLGMLGMIGVLVVLRRYIK